MSQDAVSCDNPANDPLELACIQQLATAGLILKLVEEQEKKVEVELRKMSELKGQLNTKDVEANSYQHAICVLRRFAHEDEEKMKQTQEELLQRVEEVNDLQTLNQHLIVKERATNDESTEARKELIVSLAHFLDDQSDIRIKRLGEIDILPMQIAVQRKFTTAKSFIEAARLCSLWQSKIENPEWHPFRIVGDTSKNLFVQEILDEEDEALVDLQMEWGGEAYAAVVTALKEMNECNPSARRITPELWNFTEGRRATLKEIVLHLINMLNPPQKRSRTGKIFSSLFSGVVSRSYNVVRPLKFPGHK
ncbi:unnamed protein product [Coffea canephora]|uniref:Factor of DNA methylation 1-5/IDN2 domain-containing protein n=1 Tax=Coffea canephora TaxID=49390 RepID=A0A068UGU6_COFCA|nr:unnamed protein product [Coffea canephora]